MGQIKIFSLIYNQCYIFFTEHKKAVDIDQMNQEFVDPELSLWDALESSQWFPNEVIEAH